MSDTLRDALDHIMRVARQGVSPTRRLDWIALRAKYALEGKEWSGDVRETPRDSVAKLRKDLAAAQGKVERIREPMIGMNILTEAELDEWQAFLQKLGAEQYIPVGCNVLIRMARLARAALAEDRHE